MSQKNAPRKDLARKPRGFPDKREGLIHAEQAMIARVTEVYRQWGFEALDTGAFEFADSLGKFLPDADRPNEVCLRCRMMMKPGCRCAMI